jgi:hypothetical protein
MGVNFDEKKDVVDKGKRLMIYQYKNNQIGFRLATVFRSQSRRQAMKPLQLC